MSIGDGDKLNRIEELKNKLGSRSYQTKSGHRDRFTNLKKTDVPDAWEGDTKSAGAGSILGQNRFFTKTPVFKFFFLFSLGFFALTLIYASFVFFVGGNTVSNNNIDISVLGSNFTAGGEGLSLIIGVTNRNSSPIDLADLVIEYPKSGGGGDVNSPLNLERSRISLGTISAGAVRNENIKVVLFGEQGSVRTVKISLEYRVEGSNAIFVREKTYDITINSTPLNLSVDAPTTASANQDITLNIKATLNATEPAPKMLLKLGYPVGFSFGSSVPKPSLGNNVWNLGDLAPGAERLISVTGKMLDVVDGEEKIFHITSGSQSTTDKSMVDVLFNSLSYTLAIKKPFIEANLFINGASGREYAADANAPVRGEIRWTNNLDTKVNDLVIQAKIDGNALNRKTISAEGGFYNSATDTITWDRNSSSTFKEVSPGDSGSVNFSMSPLSVFSSSGGLLPNPSINVAISISGKQLVQGYLTQNLNNSSSGVVRIISDVGFVTKALYYSGPFTNTGLIPPKVEKETSYTVVWSLSNTANNISKAVIRSTIPSWMRFVGPISPIGADLTHNPSTREIVWNIGSIPKGTGISASNLSISFQLAFTPSLSQVGTTPIIINEAILTGHDDFANVDVRTSKGSLRTQLDSDPLFPPAGGRVVE